MIDAEIQNTTQRLNVEYFIKNRDGTQEVTSGRAVKIPGFEEFSFFYRKEKGVYIISEVSTGQYIREGFTLKQVRMETIELLNRYTKEKFKELVYENNACRSEAVK